MLVGADLITVGHTSAENKLRVGTIVLSARAIGLLRGVRGLESQQEGLNHVVAIRVRREIKDVLGHLSTDGEDLLMEAGGFATKDLDKGLDSARSV